MIIITSSEHDFITGERVHFAGNIYWAKVLDSLRVELYENSSLTAVATSVENLNYTSSEAALNYITPLDRAPKITIYARSRFTNDGRGILGAFIFETSITTNITNYNIKTAAQAAGWDGNGIIYATITVAAGVYVYATTTSTPALSTGTGFPDNSKIEIVNNGYIIGRGGDGGQCSPGLCQGYGFPGGVAININYPVNITNNSYIAGGGGGGAGNGSGEGVEGGGGGAGGGWGGGGTDGFTGSLGPQAAGGAPGQAGADGVFYGPSGVGFGYGGGGGGRILPGVGGAGAPSNGAVGKGGGAGGGGASAPWPGPGGTGGSGGAAGGNGTYGGGSNAGGGAGGGGGWGAKGGDAPYYWGTYLGGVGGKAINLNGNTATFAVTGTVYGAVS